MPYFYIEFGLRGAYADGNGYCIKADTRRELKSALAWEADSATDAGFIGGNKRAVSGLAAHMWRNRKRPELYPNVIPMRQNYQPNNWAFGIHCSQVTRQEYLESQSDF